MTKSKIKSVIVVVLAAMVSVFPVTLSAQTTNKPAEKKQTQRSKPAVTPFNGKLKAVDKTAKTITVGNRTFQITSETKILKADKPAVLEDGVVGENVSGAFQKAADGKLHATKVTFGAKAAAGGDKKAKADKAKTDKAKTEKVKADKTKAAE